MPVRSLGASRDRRSRSFGRDRIPCLPGDRAAGPSPAMLDSRVRRHRRSVVLHRVRPRPGPVRNAAGGRSSRLRSDTARRVPRRSSRHRGCVVGNRHRSGRGVAVGDPGLATTSTRQRPESPRSRARERLIERCAAFWRQDAGGHRRPRTTRAPRAGAFDPEGRPELRVVWSCRSPDSWSGRCPGNRNQRSTRSRSGSSRSRRPATANHRPVAASTSAYPESRVFRARTRSEYPDRVDGNSWRLISGLPPGFTDAEFAALRGAFANLLRRESRDLRDSGWHLGSTTLAARGPREEWGHIRFQASRWSRPCESKSLRGPFGPI